MGRGFERLERILAAISTAAGYVGASLIVVTAVLITINSFARYLFNKPMMFVDEYSCYMLVALSYLGLGATLRAGKHVYVDMLVSRLPTGARNALGIATSLLGCGVIGILLYYSWKTWWSTYRDNIVSLTPLQTPLWIPHLFLAIGMTIFLLDMVTIIGRGAIELRRVRCITA